MLNGYSHLPSKDIYCYRYEEPTAELGKIHDRMPLILPKDKIEEWINPESIPEDLLSYSLTDMIFEKTV